VTTSGATTSTVYVGSLEEIGTSGGTTTAYYYAGGQRIAEAVNGTFSYLGSDSLGSAQVALDASGNVQASVLYGRGLHAHYGAVVWTGVVARSVDIIG
jgi:hypothetical protein